MLAGVSDVSTQVDRSFPGLRERLRDATAAAHRELDAQLSSFDLTVLTGYRRFLQASAGALLPLEAALVVAGVTDIFPDWPERARSAAIAADLGRLGSAAPSPVSVLPLTPGGLLGTMYVLEGSRLGAKFLLKEVAEAADPRISAATLYLRHGAGQRLWQSFLAKLESEACDEVEVIAAARMAFAAFEQAADRA
ncbi:biliverdin-producing heme oxygenase [Bradyrhizobium diazoefficiens]|uniref:biliverdin-producing heme oxygenase n=1 Tax=Bradyrhizobium sp. WYCCWR 12699 TaxID=3064203 RepID=UPI001BA755AF|nr:MULTISPECIES: biliverdin-producing heme oxygenase [Bradyrhizobium]MBR0926409.1 biliverdin-producing heme oxygenase [Bradyrhizobium diazoefficiens]MDT4743481.1 biliverdin-producing heme oxygenase [Bradyrhizobium sp. WYCCWR 12699]